MSEESVVGQFQQIVWQYYDQHGRHDLPWRLPDRNGAFDTYTIMVSELMLQQTQVNRVIPKYLVFLELFPDVQSLAGATLGDVLVAWQGLGYNRRAKYLWLAAQYVVGELHGNFPIGQQQLTALPGVGTNTAGAIMAYAYNEPVVFVETNIRTVFIHHFFDGQEAVSDKQIIEKVAETLPSENTRQWYWALMDYGTHIKQQHGNKSRASKSYVRQSPFQGSKRQIRGAVIRQLAESSRSGKELQSAIKDERLVLVLSELLAEGMVTESGGRYSLS